MHVYVRIQPDTGLTQRSRCAMEFTPAWQLIEVDDATRAALEQDPYLEVRTPDDLADKPESGTKSARARSQ